MLLCIHLLHDSILRFSFQIHIDILRKPIVLIFVEKKNNFFRELTRNFREITRNFRDLTRNFRETFAFKRDLY